MGEDAKMRKGPHVPITGGGDRKILAFSFKGKTVSKSGDYAKVTWGCVVHRIKSDRQYLEEGNSPGYALCKGGAGGEATTKKRECRKQ